MVHIYLNNSSLTLFRQSQYLISRNKSIYDYRNDGHFDFMLQTYVTKYNYDIRSVCTNLTCDRESDYMLPLYQHNGEVQFSQDQSLLLRYGNVNTSVVQINVLNYSTLDILFRYNLSINNYKSINLNNQGNILLTDTYNFAHILNFQSNKTVPFHLTKTPSVYAESNKGDKVFIADRNLIEIINVADGKSIVNLTLNTSASITNLIISPDDVMCLVKTTEDTIYKIDSNYKITQISSLQGVKQIKFINNSYCAYSTLQKIFIRNINSFKSLQISSRKQLFFLHPYHFCITPNGQYLAEFNGESMYIKQINNDQRISESIEMFNRTIDGMAFVDNQNLEVFNKNGSISSFTWGDCLFGQIFRQGYCLCSNQASMKDNMCQCNDRTKKVTIEGNCVCPKGQVEEDNGCVQKFCDNCSDGWFIFSMIMIGLIGLTIVVLGIFIRRKITQRRRRRQPERLLRREDQQEVPQRILRREDQEKVNSSGVKSNPRSSIKSNITAKNSVFSHEAPAEQVMRRQQEL